MDVNEKLKFLGNWGVVRGGGRVGWWGGGWGQGGCERNVGGRGVLWGMGDVNQE